MKDTLEREREPDLNLKGYLQNAYTHPIFKESEEDDDEEDHGNGDSCETESACVPTKHQSRRNTPFASRICAASSPRSLPDAVVEEA